MKVRRVNIKLTDMVEQLAPSMIYVFPHASGLAVLAVHPPGALADGQVMPDGRVVRAVLIRPEED